MLAIITRMLALLNIAITLFEVFVHFVIWWQQCTGCSPKHFYSLPLECRAEPKYSIQTFVSFAPRQQHTSEKQNRSTPIYCSFTLTGVVLNNIYIHYFIKLLIMHGLTNNLFINNLLKIQFKKFHYLNTPLFYSVRTVNRLRTLFA